MNASKFIRQRLKLRHVNVLVSLDDTLSVSRTAERLNVTQAAVSRTLGEAEKGFGLQIFERHSRGLRRTAPGRETLRAIRQIQSDVIALEAIADQQGAAARGEVSIGLHTVSALDRVAGLITGFKARHPHVRVRLRDGLLPELIEDLHNGRLDLVVGRMNPEPSGRRLESRALVEAEVLVVSRDATAFAAERLPALVRRPWFLPLPGTPMRLEFDRRCEEEGCAPPVDLIESNNSHLMARVLLAGERLAIAPGSVAELWRDTLGLSAIPFPGGFASEPIGLLSVAEKTHTPAVAAFLRFHAAQAGP